MARPRKRGRSPKKVLRIPDLEQFLLGHVSVQTTNNQTTERYLGCKQELRYAANDLIGLDAA